MLQPFSPAGSQSGAGWGQGLRVQGLFTEHTWLCEVSLFPNDKIPIRRLSHWSTVTELAEGGFEVCGCPVTWKHPELQGGRGGGESQCNLHPYHSVHLPDAGHTPGPQWTLTSQTNECPCVWGTHLLRSCWFPTLCRAWRNQSVYFCCLKTAYLTKNVLDLHNITCEKLNRHTSPREWKHIVNVLDVLIPYLYNLHKVHGSLGFTSEFFMCRHYPHHFQHVWRLFHAHVQSLSLHSNHHWLKSPNISFFCFCTWPAFSKATSFPLFNLLEGLFSPFIFRCAIHLEIILVHGMIYGGVDSPPQNTQLVQLIY